MEHTILAIAFGIDNEEYKKFNEAKNVFCKNPTNYIYISAEREIKILLDNIEDYLLII